MIKYKFPPERMQEVYNTLDETGGMLMKDMEFQHWVEKIVEEETARYREELIEVKDFCHMLLKRVEESKEAIKEKERRIERLLHTIGIDPERWEASVKVSINLLRSEFKNDVIKAVAKRLESISTKSLIDINDMMYVDSKPQKKGGWWMRKKLKELKAKEGRK